MEVVHVIDLYKDRFIIYFKNYKELTIPINKHLSIKDLEKKIKTYLIFK
jgi:hypothetical protein